jgi:stalled ribosome alternative rescue factor ArfA
MKIVKPGILERRFRISVLVIGLMIFSYTGRSQLAVSDFGYLSRGDSIEFIFGQEKTIVIGRQIIVLKDRFSEIKSVNVAGDFNNWNPKDANFVAVMGSDKIFRLRVARKNIGKNGETRQFKYVINQVYWVEPPKEAPNKFTGKDGFTNLTLKL